MRERKGESVSGRKKEREGVCECVFCKIAQHIHGNRGAAFPRQLNCLTASHKLLPLCYCLPLSFASFFPYSPPILPLIFFHLLLLSPVFQLQLNLSLFFRSFFIHLTFLLRQFLVLHMQIFYSATFCSSRSCSFAVVVVVLFVLLLLFYLLPLLLLLFAAMD